MKKGWIFSREDLLIGTVGYFIPNSKKKPFWIRKKNWNDVIYAEETLFEAIKRLDADKTAFYALYAEKSTETFYGLPMPSPWTVCSIPSRFVSWTEYDEWAQEEARKTKMLESYDDQVADLDARYRASLVKPVKKSAIKPPKFSEEENKLLEYLIKEINEKLMHEYIPGSTVAVEVPKNYSKTLMVEIIRRYRNEPDGWEVEFESETLFFS